MNKVIAIVRLNAGHTAYYDEITGMHLTLSSPVGYVYDNMNFSGIRRAVSGKTLKLVNGSFNIKEVEKTQTIVEEKVDIKADSSEKAPDASVEETVKISAKKPSGKSKKSSSKKDDEAKDSEENK